MRGVETAEPIDPRQEVIGHAMHNPPDIAVNVGEEAAEIGDARRRPCPAEKTVPLDQDGPATVSRGRCGRRNAGGTATKDDNLVIAVDRNAARWLVNELGSGWHEQPLC